jgi:hypothetical protein
MSAIAHDTSIVAAALLGTNERREAARRTAYDADCDADADFRSPLG